MVRGDTITPLNGCTTLLLDSFISRAFPTWPQEYQNGRVGVYFSAFISCLCLSTMDVVTLELLLFSEKGRDSAFGATSLYMKCLLISIPF